MLISDKIPINDAILGLAPTANATITVNAGKPTFMWQGKKYTTRLKEETIAQHKKKFGVSGNY